MVPVHGLIVRGLKSGGVEVGELRLRAGAHTSRLTLDEIEILFVLSGELALAGASGATRWKAGTAILRRLDINVPLTATTDTHILTLRVPSNFRGADPARLRALAGWMHLPNAAVDDLRRLHHALSAEDNELYLESLALLGVSWGERVIREPLRETTRAPWLRFVLERLSDLSWSPSLRQLSEETGVTSSHLARAFREAEGCTIGEYQRKLRVAAACRLMQSPSASLSRIALETGFTDQAHFSREFKRQMGVSPREYRNVAIGTATSGVTPQLGFDPVGVYPFRSQTADGRAYEGTIEITGSSEGYGGVVRTSVMADAALDSVAIRGRRVVLTGSVPAGLAILTLKFDGLRFTGEWRLAGKPTAVRGHRES